MKFWDKLYNLLFDSQNRTDSKLKGALNPIECGLNKSAEEPGFEYYLRERLMNFYADGNPTNLLPRDEYFHEAAIFVVLTQRCSITAIRREFSLGFNRAKLILDQLESAHIIKSFTGIDHIKVLVKNEHSLKRLLLALPEYEINDYFDLLDSFYENNKAEIEARKVEFETGTEGRKENKLNAGKLMLLSKKLRKTLPEHDKKIDETGEISYDSGNHGLQRVQPLMSNQD